MPSVSRAQNRFFHAIENDPELGKEKGVPQSVAHEYLAADKGREIGKLPEYVTRKAEGGAVKSPKRFVW